MIDIAICIVQVRLSGSLCANLGRKVGCSPLGLCSETVLEDILKHYIVPGSREVPLRSETAQCSSVEV